ncbi:MULTISPECIES: cryptochrome/photolyase family protein [Frankia]|uniref:Deoxyribodipyrimidine photolyase (DNA photolyase) (Photoreactivating enzyme) n=2 Tax=Frankia TaxID=1854 RepID=Q0RUF8_FRAAA|nr:MULTISPECIES: deoxyribodipyrimidine photo-lyase [Frankia]CAJ58783.1 Deoxyribodipyrimidine photolyase (DNA photolyase) (Photoreactivating enzyme) [Frankia alni ACN14a]
MTVSVCWLRRDLRLSDSPALCAAVDGADDVLVLFVLDDALRRPAGPVRLAFLYRCLRELDDRLGGRLCVRRGDPVDVVPEVARAVDARRVHISADYGPYGRRRDGEVEQALRAGGRELVRTGSPYAVAPGRLATAGGTPFRVFTPFYRAWKEHGWRRPVAEPVGARWALLASDGIPADPDLGGTRLPAAGERAARERLAEFLAGSLTGYAERRDVPGQDTTSRLSPYLKYGCIHPRTVLAELDRATSPRDAEKFRSELAWREFYAEVLAANPASARADLTGALADMAYDPPEGGFEAWKWGRTGFPIVDAGMRQLLAEGWVPNRVRMIEASFVCKDLHVHWTHGARWFLDHLVDGDLASNHHGWQWTAGTGTDAAPYFRVFNPVSQGHRYDPDGTYVRRWIPQLRDVPAAKVHEPWTLPGGPPAGYPAPVVDHATERRESLARYEAARRRG